MQGALRYRLGLDIGSNSIGWCVLRLNNDDLPMPGLPLAIAAIPDATGG
jgi:CRISPR/Cas system Type II protein with McrA/HNH and RuvC-like nuclease domain